MKHQLTLLLAVTMLLSVPAMAWTPKKRALLEEYTGTWCGWCARGFVGLERMYELMGDECVSVSFHNRDVMTFADGFNKKYPKTIGGFPVAYIDRRKVTDAYAGNGYGQHFGIDTTYTLACKQEAAGEIGCKAYFADAAQTKVRCDVTVRFPASHARNPYRVGLLLTADSLTGEGSSWGQVNYYSTTELGAKFTDDDMKIFVEGATKVNGLVYNFVVVGYNSPTWEEGSLPASVAADKAYTYTYTFDTGSDNDNCKGSIIQKKSCLKVVALLVDSSTGYVDNAIKEKVLMDEATGVKAVTAESGRDVYYTSGGLRLKQPQKGLNIVRRADGSTVKILRK